MALHSEFVKLGHQDEVIRPGFPGTCGVSSQQSSQHLVISCLMPEAALFCCERVINYENVRNEKTNMEILSDTDK